MAAPPPPPGPPPPPAFTAPPAPTKDRKALLGDIHKGRKLKKAVTVDKSAPKLDDLKKGSGSSGGGAMGGMMMGGPPPGMGRPPGRTTAAPVANSPPPRAMVPGPAIPSQSRSRDSSSSFSGGAPPQIPVAPGPKRTLGPSTSMGPSSFPAKRAAEPVAMAPAPTRATPAAPPPARPAAPSSRGTKAKVKWDYNPERNGDLGLRRGEIVTVLKKNDNGWWEGEYNGQTGLFPSNYVEETQDAAPAPPAPAPAPVRMAPAPVRAMPPPAPAPVRAVPPPAPQPVLPASSGSTMGRGRTPPPPPGSSAPPAPAPAPVRAMPPPAPAPVRAMPPPAPAPVRAAPPPPSKAAPPPPAPKAAPPPPMGGPPPPPGPPPPGPPPPPAASAPAPTGERKALLGDIHKGKKLKKAVTNDRSKPVLAPEKKGTMGGSGGPMGMPMMGGMALPKKTAAAPAPAPAPVRAAPAPVRAAPAPTPAPAPVRRPPAAAPPPPAPRVTQKKCVVLYPFNAERDGDLSLAVNDIVIIRKQEGNWWEGQSESTGHIGLFPANYVQLM